MHERATRMKNECQKANKRHVPERGAFSGRERIVGAIRAWSRQYYAKLVLHVFVCAGRTVLQICTYDVYIMCLFLYMCIYIYIYIYLYTCTHMHIFLHFEYMPA